MGSLLRILHLPLALRSMFQVCVRSIPNYLTTNPSLADTTGAVTSGRRRCSSSAFVLCTRPLSTWQPWAFKWWWWVTADGGCCVSALRLKSTWYKTHFTSSTTADQANAGAGMLFIFIFEKSLPHFDTLWSVTESSATRWKRIASPSQFICFLEAFVYINWATGSMVQVIHRLV